MSALIERFYTPKHVANATGAHPSTVRRWLESGYLKGTRVGEKGWWRISQSAFERFCKSKALR